MHAKRLVAGAKTGSARVEALLAAAVFGSVAAAIPAGVLVCYCAGAEKNVPAVFWLLAVGSPAVAAAVGGGVGWALMGRVAARPGVGTGAAAGLIGVVLGYSLHVGVVILALVAREVISPRDTTVKEQGSPVFYGFVLVYPASTAVFVPAAIVTGAALGLAARWWTPGPEPAEPAGTRGRPPGR